MIVEFKGCVFNTDYFSSLEIEKDSYSASMKIIMHNNKALVVTYTDLRGIDKPKREEAYRKVDGLVTEFLMLEKLIQMRIMKI